MGKNWVFSVVVCSFRVCVALWEMRDCLRGEYLVAGMMGRHVRGAAARQPSLPIPPLYKSTNFTIKYYIEG